MDPTGAGFFYNARAMQSTEQLDRDFHAFLSGTEKYTKILQEHWAFEEDDGV